MLPWPTAKSNLSLRPTHPPSIGEVGHVNALLCRCGQGVGLKHCCVIARAPAVPRIQCLPVPVVRPCAHQRGGFQFLHVQQIRRMILRNKGVENDGHVAGQVCPPSA
ncbi:unnamed protein product [Effrenium voratum]|nr:unnamed protein product [Effrenium voratum]